MKLIKLTLPYKFYFESKFQLHSLVFDKLWLIKIQNLIEIQIFKKIKYFLLSKKRPLLKCK